MSFVIRLWLESQEPATTPEWRWHVHHIQSGAEAYFRDMASLRQFIAEKGGVPSP